MLCTCGHPQGHHALTMRDVKTGELSIGFCLACVCCKFFPAPKPALRLLEGGKGKAANV